jgi:flagellar protein FlgJ
MKNRNLISKLFFYSDGSFAWTKFSAFKAVVIVCLLFVDYWYFGRVNEVILNWSIKVLPVLVLIRPAQKILEGKSKRGSTRQRGLFHILFFHADDGGFSWTKFAALFGNLMVMLLFFDYYFNDRVVEIVLEWSVAIIPVLVGLHPAQMGFAGLAKSGLSAITQRLGRSEPEPSKPVEFALDPKPVAPVQSGKEPVTPVEKFVSQYYDLAVQHEKKTGMHRIFTLAMASHESKNGKSGIGNGGYNLWGIKTGKSWKGKKVLCLTWENHDDDKQGHRYPECISITWDPVKGVYRYRVRDWFRSYDTFDQAINDWSKNILKNRYHKHAWPHRNDPYKYVEELQSIPPHYATGTDYVKSMKRRIKEVEKIIKELGL